MPQSFYTPIDASEFIHEVKRSRFMAFVYPISQKSDVSDHLAKLKPIYADARHYCWAYIIGHPEQSQAGGFSDDGEPSGTAGKPILNVLMQRKVGNATCIVVRYFGGTKLGAGGLVRAYSHAASGAMNNCQLKVIYPSTTISLQVDHASEERVRRLCRLMGITGIEVEYREAVIMHVALYTSQLLEFQQRLADATDGQATILPPL